MITFNMVLGRKRLKWFSTRMMSHCHCLHNLENLSQAGTVAVIIGISKDKPNFYKALSPLQEEGEKQFPCIFKTMDIIMIYF